jgi:hypothetical protein
LKYINFFLPFIILSADDKGPLYSDNMANSFKQEQETATSAVSKDISNQIAANISPESSTRGTSDIMIADIIFNIHDNPQISNVSDVEVLSGGYLMLFSLKTVQGVKYKIVKTSDIASIASK